MSVGDKSEPWPNESGLEGDSTNLEFEDTFVKETTFQPLDDSEIYLAALEKKLHDLKNSKKSQQEKNIVTESRKTWDSYMYRLITGESREKLNINQDQELNRSISPNILRSWIFPEQPLTVGELTVLVKHDSLA